MSLPCVLYPHHADPTPVNVERSRQLAMLLTTKDQQCYRNSLRALPAVPGAVYVEGTVVTDMGLPFSHAWLATADDTVIDPTPCFVAPDAGPRTYFAGPRWTLDEIYALLRANPHGIITPIFRLGDTLTPHVSAWIEHKLAVARHLGALHDAWADEPMVTPENEGQHLDGWLGRRWAAHVLKSARAA